MEEVEDGCGERVGKISLMDGEDAPETWRGIEDMSRSPRMKRHINTEDILLVRVGE